MIRSLLFWNIFPLAPILLKTLIACQQRKIKNQSTTSERFNMCHIERVSTAYSHVIASPANCTISLSVWNVFLWNISQLRAEVLFNTLIYSLCMPEFCTSPVSSSASPGVGERGRPGHLATCSAGDSREREKIKATSECNEIETKSVLPAEPPLYPPLSSRWFFLPVESSTSPPLQTPRSLSWCCRDSLLPPKPPQTWLYSACSTHHHRMHFHLTIGLSFMAPLLKMDEVSTFCQRQCKGTGTLCRRLE